MGPLIDMPYTPLVGGVAFTTLALNSNRTLDALSVRGYRILHLGMKLVYGAGTVTAVTMTCASSEDNSNWQTIQLLSYSGSTAVSTTHTWSHAVSGADQWTWALDLNAYRYVRCTFVGTSAGAADTLTVSARVGQ